MKKALIKILITASVLIALFTSTASADDEYSKKAKILNGLGIVSSEVVTASPTSEVTRGEAALALSNIFAKSNTAGADIYADVATKSPYYKAVYAAYVHGIDIGKDGRFYPNEAITTEDFACLAVKFSDYAFLTEKYTSSEYPYTMVANYLKIFAKKCYGTERVTNKILVDTLYELVDLKAPTVFFADGKTNFETNGSYTIAECYLGTNHATGVICSNEYSSFDGVSELKAGSIAMLCDDGRELVLHGADDYKNLIGYNCEVFYTTNKNINTIVCAVEFDNDIITIDGDDFVGFDKDKYEITYMASKYEDDRFNYDKVDRKKSIPFSAQIIFNGQYAPVSSKALDIISNPGDLDIDTVKLVDNNLDGKIDFIIADVYKVVGVKVVSKLKESVTTTDNDVITYDPNKNFYIIKRGELSMEFSGISANLTLEIKEGLGKKPLVTIDVSENNVLGSFYRIEKVNDRAYAEISEGEPSNRGSTYVGSYVGGTDNQLHIQRYELGNRLSQSCDDILLGTHMYRLFLDHKGKIAALGTYNYGGTSNYASWFMSDFAFNTYMNIEFAICLDIKKHSNLDPTMDMKVATIKKVLRTVTVENYSTSKDLKIENIPSDIVNLYGSDWKKYDIDALKALFGNMLFEIAFDTEGKINKITFPCEEKTEGKLSYYTKPGQVYVYKPGILRSITDDSFLFPSSKHMCIMVPKVGTDPDIEQLCRIFYFTQNSFADGGKYQINSYTFSKSSYIPEIMVMVNDYSTTPVRDRNTNINIGVVKKAYTVSSDNGPTDAYDVWGMPNVSPNDKTAMLVSVYGKTFETPDTGKATDKLQVGISNTYFRAPIEGLPTYDDHISGGDIVLFTMPFYNTTASSVRYFSTALKLYDYSDNKFTVTQSGAPNGVMHVVMGKVKQINDEFFSLLPDGREDKFENQLDVQYTPLTAYRMVNYEKSRYQEEGIITAATRADLEEAMYNGWTVAVASRKLIIIYKD